MKKSIVLRGTVGLCPFSALKVQLSLKKALPSLVFCSSDVAFTSSFISKTQTHWKLTWKKSHILLACLVVVETQGTGLRVIFPGVEVNRSWKVASQRATCHTIRGRRMEFQVKRINRICFQSCLWLHLWEN